MSPSWEKALPWTCQVLSIWHGAVERTLDWCRRPRVPCHGPAYVTSLQLPPYEIWPEYLEGPSQPVVLREGLGPVEEG